MDMQFPIFPPCSESSFCIPRLVVPSCHLLVYCSDCYDTVDGIFNHLVKLKASHGMIAPLSRRIIFFNLLALANVFLQISYSLLCAKGSHLRAINMFLLLYFSL
ncbi:hypothetical protein Droror1_Dr00007486 [Drosera rotundifolia]